MWWLAWAWARQKLLLSPQALAVLLTASVVALGGWSVYAIGAAIKTGVEGAAEARWLRKAAADRQAAENAVLAANGRAAAAAEAARRAAESEAEARQRAVDLESLLAELQLHSGDPEVWPHAVVRELRR